MRLSRFLFDSKHFAATKGRAKWKAFVPKTGESSLSVFNTDGFDNNQVWHHSEKYVEPERNKRTLARADLQSNVLAAHGLDFDLDEPPPRHCHIVRFPELKGEREFVAKDLAEVATLVLRDS